MTKIVKVGLLPAALLMLMTGAVQAQCYSTPYYGSSYYYPSTYYSSSYYPSTYYPSYHKEYVVKKEYVPVAVPVSYPTVAVPIYSYVNAGYGAPGYGAPGYGYPAVSAYQASPYPPGMPGYPGYQQQQTQLNTDQLADLVLKRLEQKLNLMRLNPGSGPGSGPNPVNPGLKGPPPAINSAAIGDLAKVPALLTKRCASCHSGDASSGGGFVMFNDSRQLLAISRERRWDVYDQVYQGSMPKGGTPFSDYEVELVRLWARQRK